MAMTMSIENLNKQRAKHLTIAVQTSKRSFWAFGLVYFVNN